MSFMRISVQRTHGFAIEGRIGCANFGVTPKSKSVLGVEHQRVELELDQDIDETAQTFEGGNLAARHVEHDAAHRKVGFVFDHAAGKRAPRLNELDQSFNGVAEARRTAGTNFNDVV